VPVIEQPGAGVSAQQVTADQRRHQDGHDDNMEESTGGDKGHRRQRNGRGGDQRQCQWTLPRPHQVSSFVW